MPGSQDERHLFHYFCVRGNNDITGGKRSDFWGYQLLQFSHREPLIRNVLIALSSIQLDFSGATDIRYNIASVNSLRYYNRAIKQLRQVLSFPQPPKAIVLICCVLFYAFDAARGDSAAAVKHLSNGLDILDFIARECPPTSPSEGDIGSQEVLEALAILLWGLYQNSTLYDKYDKPALERWSFISRKLPLIIRPINRDAFPGIPHSFKNLAEASLNSTLLGQQVWPIVANYRQTPIDQLPPEYFTQKQAALEREKMMMAAVDNFLQEQQRDHRASSLQSLPVYQAATIFKMTQCCHTLAIHAHMPENPEIWQLSENPSSTPF